MASVQRFLLPLLCLLLLFCLPVSAEEFRGRVSWIDDGDTLRIKGIGRVRLIGIDCPEKEPSKRDDFYRKYFSITPEHLRNIARQATRFNMKRVKGKQVRLVTDRELRDHYDRLLAYVYLPDGRMLNRVLLQQGLASVYRRFDFRHKKDFLKLEARARKKKRGLWQRNR